MLKSSNAWWMKIQLLEITPSTEEYLFEKCVFKRAVCVCTGHWQVRSMHCWWGEPLYVETMDQWSDGHLYEFKRPVRDGAFHIQIRKIWKTQNVFVTNSQYEIETAQIETYVRPNHVDKKCWAAVKLVQVESSGRDLHDEVHCNALHDIFPANSNSIWFTWCGKLMR